MKKIVFAISLLFIIFNIMGCTSLLANEESSESKELVYEDIVDEIIRFHVIANSDSEEDQSLKLKVRDRVIEYVSDELKKCQDLSESREFIMKNKSRIESIARAVVLEHGYSYDVTSELSQENFPDKVYGDLVFPQGQYEAYRILIGKATGQNWWCVMFPPLCFVDGTKEVIDTKEVKEKLLEESKDKDEDNNKNIKFKSKIFQIIFKNK